MCLKKKIAPSTKPDTPSPRSPTKHEVRRILKQYHKDNSKQMIVSSRRYGVVFRKTNF